MGRHEATVRSLLDLAGIEINGGQPWDMQVNDERFYHRVMADAHLGLGESYMDGWWDCDELHTPIQRWIGGRTNTFFPMVYYPHPCR
jgi:cyclopropane-fatty-acyl-phospholipid synthase